VLLFNFKTQKEILPQEEKKITVKKEIPLTEVNPPLPEPEESSGNFAPALKSLLDRSETDVKTMSMEEIDNELADIESFFGEEEIITKLNNNQVSAKDRQDIGELLERINVLKEARIEHDLKKLQKEVNQYQKIHPQRVKKYLDNTDN
jgi:hypothetical protein